ncbi:fibronectin type III domain-containing protein [Marilutibacter chinensis]|uniref:Fibronectin type III domain-containing protein n=1 Tax=Marilutibacter chinensis TaxID=2912247 RepID=A0ABS9HRG3_9GAMM|nr:fibronectin type III domain-containing protein [Lysobacter chinensis]MCF7221521.1 fibronectin type III domain-containing protein [Lysobacter chinensis]
MRTMQWVVAAALLAAGGTVCAQDEGKAPWEEYDKLIDKRSAITSLGPDLFGDNVDLNTGALSFSATDVGVPGNNGLAVAVGRRYSVENHGANRDIDGYDLPFADWDLDVPRISGVFATTWHDQRCSGATQPPAVKVSDKYFQPHEYWQGNQASLPGGGEMLIGSASTTRPATGGPWRWTTDGQTWFSCLSAIQNGSGEGFLAITADGTRYWFNRMAQYVEAKLKDKNSNGVPIYLPRRRNVLYATRVEDRFGNWVTYTYTNAYNAPARLTAIASSDGRGITLGYNANGKIGTVNDGTRTWQYEYASVGTGKSTLTGVVLPDGSRWSIDFAAFSEAGIDYNKNTDPGDFVRNCFNPGDILNKTSVVGTISHPSGATGTFTVFPKRHGRSNVPALCGNYSTPYNDPNDDVAYYPINWDSYSLTRKQISGPGLATNAWTYDYSSTVTWFLPPSGGGHPVCQDSNGCEAPQCTDDSCAGTALTTVTAPDGSWTRYAFGNSYRYNEGKLLRIQKGTGSTPLHTERIEYVLAQSGQPYPTPIGDSPQARGNAFTSEYIRPQKRREIVREGSRYINEVEQFDSFARPLRVRKYSFATGGSHVDPPSSAPSLNVPASSGGSFNVSWAEVNSATEYRLEQSKDGGGWVQVYSGSGLSKTLSGLGNGTYDYRGLACNAGGCSGYSATRTTVVTVPPSGVPVLSAPATDSDGAFTVSWPAVSAATSYRLEQRKDGGGWAEIYNGSGLSKNVSGLGSGTYDYLGRACNAGGCGGYSEMKTTVVSAPVPGVPVLSAPQSANTNQDFTVSWTDVGSVTHYELQSGDGSAAGWATIYTGTATSRIQNHRFEGEYSYRVRACNANGCSAFSTARKVSVVGGGGGDPLVAEPVSSQDEQPQPSEGDGE